MNDQKNFFSLIELLTVMAVIAILLAITIGIFSLARDKMNNSKTRAIIKQLDIALQSYKLEQGYYFVDSNTINVNFPDLASAAQTSWNISASWWFKLNYNNSVDIEFIKDFEYQTLIGSGNITDKALNGATLNYSYVKDAWGRPILYKYPGTFNPQMFDIGSLGRDGRYGDNSNSSNDFGKGDDITNFNNN